MRKTSVTASYTYKSNMEFSWKIDVVPVLPAIKHKQIDEQLCGALLDWKCSIFWHEISIFNILLIIFTYCLIKSSRVKLTSFSNWKVWAFRSIRVNRMFRICKQKYIISLDVSNLRSILPFRRSKALLILCDG